MIRASSVKCVGDGQNVGETGDFEQGGEIRGTNVLGCLFLLNESGN